MLSKSLSTSRKFAKLAVVSGKLTEFCQSLYPLINSHADDFGRLAGDPFTVKHVCHPTSARKVAEFGLALQYLDDVGLIRWYEVDGCSYIQMIKFDEHQTGLHKRTTSRIPECSNKNASAPYIHGSSGNEPEILGQEKRRELKRREENLTEEKRKEKIKIYPEDFADFWNVYPRKIKKDAALDAWELVKPDVAVVLTALTWQVNQPGWHQDGGKFVPHPATWLNQRRWEDEPFTPSGAYQPDTRTNAGRTVAAAQRVADRLKKLGP